MHTQDAGLLPRIAPASCPPSGKTHETQKKGKRRKRRQRGGRRLTCRNLTCPMPMYASTPRLMKWKGDACSRPLSRKKSVALVMRPAVSLPYPVIFSRKNENVKKKKKRRTYQMCRGGAVSCSNEGDQGRTPASRFALDTGSIGFRWMEDKLRRDRVKGGYHGITRFPAA